VIRIVATWMALVAACALPLMMAVEPTFERADWVGAAIGVACSDRPLASL
jgi:hypothetical protein